MFADPAGPIEAFTWGRFVIAGQEHGRGDPGAGQGKDLRILFPPLTVTRWAERTGHHLRIDMITGIFDQGLEVLLLGLGANRAIACPPELVEEIRRRGIPAVELHDTAAACRRFNELVRQGRKVGLLAHGTC
ncbi:MAG: hypothetical protein OZSIB_3169 [Candidatus Ozemobacter sibiricus]|uniref:Uncharacterized protein n=1 Tax=Candidatus Ozemobacter sibiricus TaxID=2268124 RepID=A0A367ZQN5_9BACT|nr:MAG: hypothetical protein OZSIB_3169 [Candidatus Ozemobacter sibiricus]